MKLFAGLAVVMLAVPGVAQAAGNINGSYSIKYTTLCQSIENELFKPSTQIQTIQEGKISQTVGVITFTPTTPGGLSGKVSAVFTQTQGTLAILGLPGPPASPHVPDMQIGTGTPSGTYSVTPASGAKPATIKINLGTGSGSTFTAYLSKLKGAVYTHADFIGIDGDTSSAPSCSNAGSIDLN
jgi:hypothetical protein